MPESPKSVHGLTLTEESATPTRPEQRDPRRTIQDLRAALRAASQGHSLVVELSGPDGSGKTHLLSRFVAELRSQRTLVMRGECRTSDWLPFAVLRRMLSAHLAQTTGRSPEERQEVEAQLRIAAGDSLPWLGVLLPELNEATHSPSAPPRSEDSRHLFIECIANFLLQYLQNSTPAVLIIDDCQWLDTSSRKVLTRLLSQLDRGGVLVVLARRESREASQLLERTLRGVRAHQTVTLEIGPLSEEEGASILQAHLGHHAEVDAATTRALLQEGDGTPQSLRGVLNCALESGALTLAWGRWTLDRARFERSVRNQRADTLGALGVHTLPEDARSLLETLALCAGHATPALLARALDKDLATVEGLLRTCEAHQLTIHTDDGELQLRQDSLREALEQGMRAEGRAERHLRLARALSATYPVMGDVACAIAMHLAAAGDLTPSSWQYEVSLLAAEYARGSHDDARALSFFELVDEAAARAGHQIPAAILMNMGETAWQNGRVARCLELYHRALEHSDRSLERSLLLGRMAWVYHYSGEPERALRLIEEALAGLGEPMPKRAGVAVPKTAIAWLGLQRLSLKPRRSSAQLALDEARCTLCVRAYRMYMERGMTGKAMYCSMRAARIAASLPPSPVTFHALSSGASLLATFGASKLGFSLLDNFERQAREFGDPVALTRCLVAKHVSSAWTGDTESARITAYQGGVEHGAFMDLGDYCLLCLGMHVMETALGQPNEALRWLERVVERAALHEYAPGLIRLVEEAAKGTLATLNREHELSRIQRSLQEVDTRPLASDSFPLLLSYQYRIVQLTELGTLGVHFEELVDAFEARVTDGHLKHPMTGATYVHIMHARVHQGLRGSSAERRNAGRRLRRILQRVRGIERGDVANAHLRVAEAAQVWFLGNSERAQGLLAEAERLAQRGPCVWVLFSVARLRAHMLRDRGWEQSAMEQARVAALIATKHGHQNRVRWIVDEFGPQSEVASLRDEPGTRGTNSNLQQHLGALLTISRTGSADLSLPRQAAIILEEIVQALAAARGRMLLRGARGLEEIAHHQDTGVSEQSYSPWVVEAAYSTGQILRLDPNGTASEDTSSIARPTLCAPLILRGESMGVIYLDRDTPSQPAFSAQDGELLLGLASQVPIALELAKSLREREGLETHLRQAQKMEAIGQLAGGIAHDFNNLLATVQVAGGTLAELLTDEGVGHEELEDILDVAQRGAALTRQLLTFARRETAVPRPLDLQQVLESMMPMLCRLVGGPVSVDLTATPQLPALLADRTQIEQVVLNLVTNARDAIAGEGHIALQAELIDSEQARSEGLPPDLEPGTYVTLRVSDDGCGMSQETQQRVFEPFYSTKPSEVGTGLGLSIVYGIVQQAEGHILLRSQEGAGSTFSIYWPALSERATVVEGTESSPGLSSGQETVLVLEGDRALARATERALSLAGYEVLCAESRQDAIELFDDMDGAIDLVIGDGQLVTGEGLALLDQWLKSHENLCVLLVSGDPTLGSSAATGHARVDFLLKPFPAPVLSKRIRTMLDAHGTIQ